jgi:hypothetical protein
MPDDKSVKAEESVVETETTQVDSPTTEAPTTGGQTTQGVVVDQDTSLESPDESPAGSENWTAEQRRAFQEQRQEIKRLKEQVVVRERSESAFNAFRPQTPPISQPNVVRVENYTDQVTGETNWSAYNQAVAQRDQQVISQAQYVAQQTVAEALDENNARTKFPEVMNDREAEQEVADRWFAAKMRGENPSIADIAARVAKRDSKTISKAEKIGAEKAFNEISEKEKAGLSATGQTSEPARQVASSEEQADLSFKTQRGNYDAVTSRISKIPWANK